MAVRDLKSGARSFFFLNCWFLGVNIASITLVLTSNQSVIQALFFSGSQNVLLWSSWLVIWWFAFYSPYNSFQSATEKTPFRQVLCFGKELLRCNKIWRGLQLGARFVAKGNIEVQIGLGFVNACASGFFINFGKALFSGNDRFDGTFWLSTGMLTKLSLLFTVLYAVFGYQFYGVIVMVQVFVFMGFKCGHFKMLWFKTGITVRSEILVRLRNFAIRARS